MAKEKISKENFKNELKALGGEISKAVGEMKNSPEFKKIKKDVSTGFKSLASSLSKAVQSAKESPSADRIKNRFQRVVKAGKKEGFAKAQKAETMATKKIKEARTILKDLSRKIKS